MKGDTEIDRTWNVGLAARERPELLQSVVGDEPERLLDLPREGLSSDSSERREAAAFALGAVAEAYPEISGIPTEQLQQLVERDDDAVRMEAAWALTRVEEVPTPLATTVELLVETLDSDNKRKRIRTAEAMGGIGSEQALAPLRDRLEGEPDPDVRTAIEDAIEEIRSSNGTDVVVEEIYPLVTEARNATKRAARARSDKCFEEAMEAWSDALDGYEQAHEQAKRLCTWDELSDIMSAIEKAEENLQNTKKEYRCVELVEKARSHTEDGNDHFDQGDYREARAAYERALDGFKQAYEIATQIEVEEAEQFEETIADIERSIENCQLESVADALVAADETLQAGDPEAAETEFRNVANRIENLDIDRPDDVASLRTEARSGRIRSRIARARNRLNDAETLSEDEEYYEARKTFREIPDFLDEVLESATEYGFSDLQREIDDLIELATTNEAEARRALYDIDEGKPDFEEVGDVGSSESTFTPPNLNQGSPTGRTPEPTPDPTPGRTAGSSLSGADVTGIEYSELPNHEEVEWIDRGGNATVWKIRLVESGKIAALKRPHFRGTTTVDDARRFLREAKIWAKVSDFPNVVTLYDWGYDGEPWLLMEYLDGGDLGEFVGEVPVERSVDILLDVTTAMTDAYQVDHLDVKPENVLLDDDGTAKMADWGLAHTFFMGDLTDTSMGMSPPYAAPEQIDKSPDSWDNQTDIYQLGVTAYELVTGELPFDPAAPKSLERRILEQEPQPPSALNPAVPPELDEVIMTAMAKDPDDRYEVANQVRDALKEVRNTL